MSIIVNGIAHIVLSVKDLNKSKIFYKNILPFLGLKLIQESEKSLYYVGARTGVLIQESVNKKLLYSQDNIGLHHFCFRAKSKKDVYLLSDHLIKNNIRIIRGPLDGPWVNGYFYILFEDPDGIRIELNFIPGQGVLDSTNKFKESGNY